MEKHCSTISFGLKNRKDKSGMSPITMTIGANGERAEFQTGRKIAPENWDNGKQQAKGKTTEAKLLNAYLNQLRNKVYLKEIELMQRGYLITARLLRDAVIDKVEALNEKTLFQVLAEHNEEQKKLVGNGVSKATYFISEYTDRLLKEYVKQKYKREDLFLRELNLSFIQSFHTFLKIDKRMAQNSSTKHLKLLKKIINMAVANSYITYNPFATYKVEREPVEIDFLDEEELRKIINFDTPLPRLERAKDMFLFGCFTGLSYIDIKTLAPEHFEKDGTGRIWIKKRRIKTGILSRIPLLPIAKLILDKYKDGEKLLPIPDPADINKYLKDIAILCDIKKRITFHTSRHTFASTVTLANNISLEVVSKMLGHTNTRMTTHYAKLIDKCIGEQMDKLIDTFSKDSDFKDTHHSNNPTYRCVGGIFCLILNIKIKEMEIQELLDFKRDWNIAFKDNNIDLLEYVVDVANKFHPLFDGIDFSPSNDPLIFNNRYIESNLNLRERYNRMCSMGYFKDYSREEYEKNNTKTPPLDTSFREKYLDTQLQNTIAAYGLDVSKFWYLILYVNDYVKDLCVNAFKSGEFLLDELNDMIKNLSEATEVILKKNGRKCFSSVRKEVVNILKIAMEHFINDYNAIMEIADENINKNINEKL